MWLVAVATTTWYLQNIYFLFQNSIARNWYFFIICKQTFWSLLAYWATLKAVILAANPAFIWPCAAWTFLKSEYPRPEKQSYNVVASMSIYRLKKFDSSTYRKLINVPVAQCLLNRCFAGQRTSFWSLAIVTWHAAFEELNVCGISRFQEFLLNTERAYKWRLSGSARPSQIGILCFDWLIHPGVSTPAKFARSNTSGDGTSLEGFAFVCFLCKKVNENNKNGIYRRRI